MTIRTKQGKGGKWRWHLYDGEQHTGMSSIQGFESRSDAQDAALRAFGKEVYLEAASGELLFAGQRDFQ